MNIIADRAIAKLAQDQAGVITRAQALDAGLHSATISRRVTNEVWCSPFRGVYVVAPWPDRRLQRVSAAVSAAGPTAVASHDTALWLHGLRTGAHRVIHITTPSRKPRSVARDVVVHTTRSLEAFEIVEACAVRSTDVPRALADVAWSHRRELERLVFDAFRVVERGVTLAEVDFADPATRVAVEIDGYRYHATPAEKRYDDRRQNLLVSRGWTVLRFTYADLRQRPAAVVAEIRRTVARSSAER